MPDSSDPPIADEATVARSPSAPRPSYERFSPGDVLDDRFRIVALLGRGGMGEVYRAEDMKLGQQVALKFLPRDVIHQSAIERLYGEVRLGRKISHPNVCRLYDIGEWEGNHFVTMEYIDGEDLASLLRRIGQLPYAKAVELAQDICAGLAAAHGLGVVHRDLKPANIMIDGRGNAIITDFGLAALAEELETRQEFAGTPAYMAPEQLSGGTVTHRSDLYALGLILYEMFTGHRKFEGRSVEEMRKLHESADPSSISRETKSIDPVIQQVVLRCLEPEPEERPRSIHSVIAALPGADPLQAAVEAGETPSPEMVAAAGKSGELSIGTAAALAAAALVLLAGLVWLKQRTEMYGVVPLPKHPRVLEAEAREILEQAGLDALAKDSSYYLGLDADYFEALPEERPEMDVATAIVSPMVFYYRQSPSTLIPMRGYLGDFRILPDDPPQTLPGMGRVTLTPTGRLRNLLIVPDASALASDGEPAWDLLFERAHLDFGSATEIAPPVPAPVDTDQRRSWTLDDPANPERQLRVDAAAIGNRIVWFDVVPPWRTDELGDRQSFLEVAGGPQDTIVTIVIIIVLVFGIVFARRNLRRGRGDRRGALRLGAAIFAGLSASSLLRADLAGPISHVWQIVVSLISTALFRASVIAILYLAIEPYLRRRWPSLLVSWSRLLAGRWRDPLVGRHILIGGATGALLVFLGNLFTYLDPQTSVTPGGMQSTLTSVRQGFAVSINGALSAFLPAFVMTTIMVGVSVLFSRRMAGAAVLFILLSIIPIAGIMGAGDLSVLMIVGVLLRGIVVVGVLYRLGVLAALATWAMINVTVQPLTFDTNAFYFPSSAIAVVIILGLLVWGFAVSIAHRSPHHTAFSSSDSL